MRTILLDGESKVGKTSVNNAIIEDLQRGHSVLLADAGAFFRRITAAVLDILKVKNADAVPPDVLDKAVKKVLRAGTAFEDEYPWGDLEREPVGKLVSVISQRADVQAAGELWYAETAERALASGVDVLVLNGRNPRARLGNHDIGLCLELLIQCDPEVAGLRAVLAKGIAKFSVAVIAKERDAVIARRQLDRNRADNPFVEPPHVLPFVVGKSSPKQLLADSWDAPAAEAPYTIGFDTSHVPIEVMTKNVQALAHSALEH